MDKTMHGAGCPEDCAMDDYMSDMMDDIMNMSRIAHGDQSFAIAMAYVPWQNLHTVYEPESGFGRGTIFPELDKPWMPGGVCCE